MWIRYKGKQPINLENVSTYYDAVCAAKDGDIECIAFSMSGDVVYWEFETKKERQEVLNIIGIIIDSLQVCDIEAKIRFNKHR